MQVTYGRTCPPGFLPVYFVDSEEEAKTLVVLTCAMGPDGKYYARELAAEQTLDNLDAFSKKIEQAHEFVKKKQKGVK